MHGHMFFINGLANKFASVDKAQNIWCFELTLKELRQNGKSEEETAGKQYGNGKDLLHHLKASLREDAVNKPKGMFIPSS